MKPYDKPKIPKMIRTIEVNLSLFDILYIVRNIVVNIY